MEITRDTSKTKRKHRVKALLEGETVTIANLSNVSAMIFGVLDIDSFKFNNFGETDVAYLEKLVVKLEKFISHS